MIKQGDIVYFKAADFDQGPDSMLVENVVDEKAGEFTSLKVGVHVCWFVNGVLHRAVFHPDLLEIYE